MKYDARVAEFSKDLEYRLTNPVMDLGAKVTGAIGGFYYSDGDHSVPLVGLNKGNLYGLAISGTLGVTAWVLKKVVKPENRILRGVIRARNYTLAGNLFYYTTRVAARMVPKGVTPFLRPDLYNAVGIVLTVGFTAGTKSLEHRLGKDSWKTKTVKITGEAVAITNLIWYAYRWGEHFSKLD